LESPSIGDSAIAITSCAQNSQGRLSVEVQNELTARELAVHDKRDHARNLRRRARAQRRQMLTSIERPPSELMFLE
jgi:hypothetical protein